MKAQSNAQPCTGSDSVSSPLLLGLQQQLLHTPHVRAWWGDDNPLLMLPNPPCCQQRVCRGSLGQWLHRLETSCVTSSASILSTPPPRSLIMQNATVPACPGNYRPAKLQLLSLVLKAHAFHSAHLSPLPESSCWSTHALNSISWP